jgi:hypothetical protein
MADVTQLHPDYEDVAPDWELMRDAVNGETAVKDKAEEYLPMPSGFTAQDDGGAAMYAGYLLRAKFPEILGPTLRGMVGILHRVEAEIELPAKLEPLREKATKDGMPLAALHERITYELFATGRHSLLVDAPEEGAEVPYLASYTAESLINWSYDQDFYVLDESHLNRDGFEWKEAHQYRVLELKNLVYQQTLYAENESGTLTEEAPIVPAALGGKTFEEIPLVVIGSTDIGPDVCEIPLIGVARCQFNMYRIDADYKWGLFMTGQETLFVYSDTETNVNTVGAGVVIKIPKESKAEYVGPSGVGIEKQKEAILDEREQAVMAGARLFDTEKKQAESGEALKMRWSAQTASLTTIALNAAKGLERALRYAAIFVGANPDEVIVKPNLRFIDTALDPAKAKYLMDLWMGGAISKRTLFDNLQRGDITSYDVTFEEEEELIDQDMPDLDQPLPGAPGGAPGSNLRVVGGGEAEDDKDETAA